jgi:putative SOS response-associated peptidase YedK
MPVILKPAGFEQWLSPDTPADELKALLRPYPADRMKTYPVTPRVGSPTLNELACIEPLAL